jgi:hypothetical protein
VPQLVQFSVGGNIQRLSPCLLGESGFTVVDVVPGRAAAAGSDLETRHELAVRACGTAEREAGRLTELVREWDAADRPGTDRLLIDAYPSGVSVSDAGGSVHPAQHMTFIVSSR